MENEKLSEIVRLSLLKVQKESGKMTLFLAKHLSLYIRQKAREFDTRVVICVANDAGHPVLVEAMDDAYIASYDIAVNKAFTSASLKMSTATLATLAKPDGSLYGIQFTNGGKIVIFGGGEPLYSGGKIIGAIGVSGGTEEIDRKLAELARKFFENI